MVHISDAADKVLKDYFKDKEVSPIRVFLHSGGWGGPSLALVLDEPKETDEVFKINGFTMLMDKELHETTKDVTVDYVNYGMRAGFQVSSQIPVAGGGGCGSSCSC